MAGAAARSSQRMSNPGTHGAIDLMVVEHRTKRATATPECSDAAVLRVTLRTALRGLPLEKSPPLAYASARENVVMSARWRNSFENANWGLR
jgi:hypothetical protein